MSAARLTATERDALVLGFRDRLRRAGNPSAATKWWADDLAEFAQREFEAILAARLAAVEALAAEWEAEDTRYADISYECATEALRAALSQPTAAPSLDREPEPTPSEES